MTDIRINQLPAEASPVATDVVPIDGATVGGATRKTTNTDLVQVGRPTASQAEAEAGTNPTKAMTPLTTSQAVGFYGLTKAGNLAGLADKPTARSNLDLGNSSTRSVGTTAGTVAAGDDARIVDAAQRSVYDPNNKNDDAFSSDNHDYQALPAGPIRSPALRLREELWAEDNAVVGNQPATDTPKINELLDTCRSWGVDMRFKAKTYQTNAPLNIAGLTVEGVSRGWLNQAGTIIEASGSYPVIEQATATLDDTTLNIFGLRLKGGSVGLKTRYTLHSEIRQVYVTDCVDGIEFGNIDDAGGLFTVFEGVRTDVSNVGLKLNGFGFQNAARFESCSFKGGQYGATIDHVAVSGLGSQAIQFDVCEFFGARYGLGLIGFNVNVMLNTPYFESTGPSVLIDGVTRSLQINNGLYAGLKNNNPTGRTAFIYHTDAEADIEVRGGWILVPPGVDNNNLTFLASEAPIALEFGILRKPNMKNVDSGANFTFLPSNLISANRSTLDRGDYTPVWAASGTQPSLGDGELSGKWTRAGNTVTGRIRLKIGSTTTLGSGVWNFTIPFPVGDAMVCGSARCLDLGTGYAIGVSEITASSLLVVTANAGILSPVVPFTWATGDELEIGFTYSS